jgi:hypothetical protein
MRSTNFWLEKFAATWESPNRDVHDKDLAQVATKVEL